MSKQIWYTISMKTLIESLEKTESYCQEIPYYPTSLKRPAPPPCSEEILPFLFLLPLAQKQTVTERSIRLAAGFQLIHLSRAIHGNHSATDMSGKSRHCPRG